MDQRIGRSRRRKFINAAMMSTAPRMITSSVAALRPNWFLQGIKTSRKLAPCDVIQPMVMLKGTRTRQVSPGRLSSAPSPSH